ncbi:hypothetical protein M011DRAFT_461024 [Sporormia fimetaria CBS 119925]|uniref:C2H2-type domain-containing protein n=1 Tax=Sporormia fimetaria CBS 119925 TaxID=1340428 RepID=A0A6A6V2Y4_9PLEO|nr:hypothetical protein M011DRAFT_461024 [Sporormia fimetaria CBS 119925]
MTNSRDQPTPPFNSPYQHAMRLQSASYPSPARSDTDPSRLPAEGLGLYVSQPYAHSIPPTTSSLYSPSPQPTEPWSSQLASAAGTMMTEAPMDHHWTPHYHHSSSRSPPPWAHPHVSQRSSVSSAMFSNSEWASDAESPPAPLSHGPAMTVAPDHLTSSVFPYGHSPLPEFASLAVTVSIQENSQSPPSSDDNYRPTPRTRIRRHRTTEENANFKCDECGGLFTRAFNYNQHLKTHDPDRVKAFQCTYTGCNKPFGRKTDLDRHINSVHLKAKPHRCGRCKATFARKDTLRRHEEDGCSHRHQITDASAFHRTRAMRATTSPGTAYYHSPNNSFPGTPSGY